MMLWCASEYELSSYRGGKDSKKVQDIGVAVRHTADIRAWVLVLT